MKRKHKQYSRPKRPFDKERIDEEAKIKSKFGLKNKKEIWMAEAKIKSMREKAKKLIGADSEKQEALFLRLQKMGIKVESIADILSLTKEDYLGRRLQSIVHIQRLGTTAKGARQLITHKKILVNGRVVSSPSYIVPVEFEDKIRVKKSKPKVKKKIEAPAESESADEPTTEGSENKTEEESK